MPVQTRSEKRKLKEKDAPSKKQRREVENQDIEPEEALESVDVNVVLTNGDVRLTFSREVLKESSSVFADILQGDIEATEICVKDVPNDILLLFKSLIDSNIDYSADISEINKKVTTIGPPRTWEFYLKLVPLMSKYDLKPFQDFIDGYMAKCCFWRKSTWFIELDKLLKRYNYAKQADEFAFTQLSSMFKFTAEELFQWPTSIMNDLVDRVWALGKSRWRYSHCTSVFKYLVVNDDNELKIKITQIVDTFDETIRSKMKHRIWQQFASPK